MACVRQHRDEPKRKGAVELFLWFQANSGAVASIVTDVNKETGEVKFATPYGKETIVRKGDFIKAEDWDRVRIGSYVYYCIAGGGRRGSAVGVMLV
jgi:hypothetical protein